MLNVGMVLFVCLIICGGIAIMLLTMKQYREASRIATDRNNLKQIGLAMHHYYEVYSWLPPGGIVRDDGTEMMSWTASLLPYLVRDPLFHQINPDFGWKSPLNQAVFSQTIATLTNPGITEPTGPGISHYAGNSHLFQINKCWAFREITDGTSNTIAVGDVAAGFKQWGDPTNVRDPGLGIGRTPQIRQPLSRGNTLSVDGRIGAVRFREYQLLDSPGVGDTGWGRA